MAILVGQLLAGERPFGEARFHVQLSSILLLFAFVLMQKYLRLKKWRQREGEKPRRAGKTWRARERGRLAPSQHLHKALGGLVRPCLAPSCASFMHLGSGSAKGDAICRKPQPQQQLPEAGLAGRAVPVWSQVQSDPDLLQ